MATAPVHPTDVVLPDFRLADWQHILTLPNELTTEAERQDAKVELMKIIEDSAMLPYYRHLCSVLGWPVDDALSAKLAAENTAELEKLDAAIEEAKEKFGDVEVKDALLAKAHHFCRIGDQEVLLDAYSAAFEKTVGVGGRLDVLHTLVRLGLCQNDPKLVSKNIARAKGELDRGGDWERMNKLKVYEGLSFLTMRRFKESAKLFLDATATFTATEIVSFEKFIFYTIVLGLLTLDRPVLKSRLLTSPEVLQVTAEDEDLRQFMHSFYHCDYALFMNKLVLIAERIRKDRYMGRHLRYYLRNIRLRAYSQFLEPFRSVTLKSMANAFTVSESFIEEEVAAFIASGKLCCKIDRVNGVIERNRWDKRDALYLETLKQGDALLNRIQKLSRVIDM